MLDLGGGDVDTATPTGSTVFTVVAALARTERETEPERNTDSEAERRAAGKDPGERCPIFTDSRVRNALRLIESREPVTRVVRGLKMSGQSSTGGSESSRRRRPSERTILEQPAGASLALF